jgi:Ca2+-binding EF-hand superfamily protein
MIMKKLTFLMIVAANTVFLSLSAQVPSKEMEKNVRKIYKDLLKETDKDKDGKISKSEYLAIYKDKKKAEENFKKWDVNKDGYLTEDEYVKVIMDMGKKK